jgi:hypothetical protein
VAEVRLSDIAITRRREQWPQPSFLIFREWRSLSHNTLHVRFDLGFHVLASKIVDFTSITRSSRKLLRAHKPHLQVGDIDLRPNRSPSRPPTAAPAAMPRVANANTPIWSAVRPSGSWYITKALPDETIVSPRYFSSTDSPGCRRYGRPGFVYPKNDQTLDYEGAYLFKVKPVPGASGYLWGFFQGGKMVWENYADERKLSGTEYGIQPGTSAHKRFVEGDVDVWVRGLGMRSWQTPLLSPSVCNREPRHPDKQLTHQDKRLPKLWLMSMTTLRSAALPPSLPELRL